MDTAFQREAVEEATAWHGKPEIFNTDKAAVHEQCVHRAAARPTICISMDGKGCWRDDVFIKRPWCQLMSGLDFMTSLVTD